MLTSGNDVQNKLLARAKDLLSSDPNLAHFLKHTISDIDPQDFVTFPADEFETVLKHSMARLNQVVEGAHLINIWSPEGESAKKTQIVDIFSPNMPFLVDSILAAVRAKGGTVQLMAHPILPLDLSKSEPQVAKEASGKTISESFLHIHMDPIGDEDAIAGLFDELNSVLTEVQRTVQGWRPMLERLRALVQNYRKSPPELPANTLAEMLHFLAWLADHNFTFLGMREYRLTGTGEDVHLEPVPNSGLGILTDSNLHFLRAGADYGEMTAQHTEFLQSDEPLMVTKANIRARVHRRAHMDYVGVKLFDENGAVAGELRMIGLFTSMSFSTPHTEVPLLRRKISETMRRSGNDPKSHAGKALMAALDNYPREELFQISNDELFEFATIISALPDRPRVRVLPRIDRFDNFVSILLYLPRDRYTSDVRANIGDHLAATFDGRVSAYYPHFPEGDLVRVHFIIGRNGGKTPRPDRAELEAEVEALTRTFGDRLLEAADDAGEISAYWDAFSAAYQTQNSHEDALNDIEIINALGSTEAISVRLSKSNQDSQNPTSPEELHLKVYHVGTPIPLSDRVPMLENFGFRVIDERTYSISPRDHAKTYLHDMLIRPGNDREFDLDSTSANLERALLAVWEQHAESDGFNQLTVTAALAWDDVAILRALSRYLKQIGFSFSQRYIWSALNAHPDTANDLVELFHTRHLPDFDGTRETAEQSLVAKITETLTHVQSADEDLIIRHLLNLVTSSLRTNFYQRDAHDARRPALAIKFDCAEVIDLPEPRPYREIFVYSPIVEGVHLRGGPIARGGLRWSDRPEDFRTEVLGLVKAQMVKNAIIVPVGAKGGFVPKLMPANPDRDTFLTIGTDCYKIFIGALLDITDNLDGDEIIKPENVMRHDGDDPYLVVAADKGTATFSDTANGISESRNFWLGDAFASGGSAGYDHKKMGITARGGWEAVKRHFRELDRNIQEQAFTAVGVGDMSGDVFGNGMILSKATRLVAAFDHRDIFIDPDPSPKTSYNERKRLFDMGRSSWQEYDTALLSEGGGIYPRNAKSIDLSPQARALLDLGPETLTPQEVMRAILKANVDLLWFGGIGTYVRSSAESNTEAGDRANDALRITGGQVRAKVIGEGANLGITHLGRIEFAEAGGRINTDAIDNSAGVNSSDLEVNIKIALGNLIRNGDLTIEDRNAFLVEMTDEVAELCLRNNYLQTLTISLAQKRGMVDFPDLVSFIQGLEARGELNREIEYLPDDNILAERAIVEKPFSRPELSTLLAYAKNTLYADLLASDVPDDEYLARDLSRYFPEKLKQTYPATIDEHRLRREVIATVLSNAMINRGGPTFVHRMTTATSGGPEQVAFAYAAARDAYGLQDLNLQIDALDNKMEGATQLNLYAEIQTLLVDQTLWFLRNVNFDDGLSSIVQRYRTGVLEVKAVLAKTLPQFIAQSVADQAVGFVNGGAPTDIARTIAELSALTLASDIILSAEKSSTSNVEAAEAYFTVLETFKLGRITEQGGRINLTDKYDRMALDRALANIMRAQRDLTGDILVTTDGPIPKRFDAWRAARGNEIHRITDTVTKLTEEELTVSRISVAAGLLSDLVKN